MLHSTVHIVAVAVLVMTVLVSEDFFLAFSGGVFVYGVVSALAYVRDWKQYYSRWPESRSEVGLYAIAYCSLLLVNLAESVLLKWILLAPFIVGQCAAHHMNKSSRGKRMAEKLAA